MTQDDEQIAREGHHHSSRFLSSGLTGKENVPLNRAQSRRDGCPGAESSPTDPGLPASTSLRSYCKKVSVWPRLYRAQVRRWCRTKLQNCGQV